MATKGFDEDKYYRGLLVKYTQTFECFCSHDLGILRISKKIFTFQPECRGFESSSSRPVGTLGKSLTRSCLWRFGVKLRHSNRAVSGTLPSGSGLKEAL